ncbi:hypothetical protein [Henriciella mobilis]|uniref:Uncharacterized protein n=1 Tax=Henriciella mobilis TaxID=2305467 RepID=A0A399RIQ2_9PROT|nr:hypothetical protein [Henriciella mobilis]RIJ29712.1 hypothetical protein D1223_09570 [Henriciella mobilis]
MAVSRLSFSALILAALTTGVAQADSMKLTSAEHETVVQACELGLPFIPVESDFGYQTGQFALPVSDDGGDVHSAIILEEASLRTIPECKGEVEDAIARRDDAEDTRSS